MSKIITVGLDLAKNVFQVHGADGAGRVALRKKLRRAQVLEFFSQLPSCVVAMEACGGAHFWGREIGKLGHEVRLIPPAYVKPFVKCQKNDMADAEAICEAAMRPTMRFVPAKSEEIQGAATVFRVRELLIRQRTQAINALRGHLTEFGQIVPQGASNAAAKQEAAAPSTAPLPPPATSCRQPSARPPPGRRRSRSSTPKGNTPRAGPPSPSMAAICSRSAVMAGLKDRAGMKEVDSLEAVADEQMLFLFCS